MNFSISANKVKLISIAYLALPVLLFFLSWLKLPYGIFLTCLLLFSFHKYFQHHIQDKEIIEMPIWQLMAIICIVLLWVFISGAGGWGLQSHDHAKSNAIYKDIIERAFPVSYKYQNQTIYLSTYLAYYLTIPTIFGFLKWEIVMTLVTIWTFLGVFLGIFWFCALAKSFSPFVVIFFIFVGGWDIAGQLYNTGFNATIHLFKNEFYEHQPFFAIMTNPKMMTLYQSNTHCLFWSPQHAIASWLASGLFFYEFINKKDNTHSAIYLVLLPFWSPFILVGLAPFYLFSAINQGLKKYLIASNFALIPILFVLAWFVNSIPMGDVSKGFIFYKPDRLLGYFEQGSSYLFFIFFEVIIWAIPVYFIFKKNEENYWKKLLIFTVILLMFIPFYTLGKFNDWSQRVSMPALFLFWIMVVKTIQSIRKDLFYKIIFVILFIFGSWDPLFFILLSLKVTDYKIKYTMADFSKVTNYLETSNEQKWPVYHSFAPENAPIFKYLMKEPKEEKGEK